MNRSEVVLAFAAIMGMCLWGFYLGVTGGNMLPSRADRGCPPAHATPEYLP